MLGNRVAGPLWYRQLPQWGNLAFECWFGLQPSTRLATFLFGLCHGLGLATRQLARSTALAAGVAALLLIIVVLPAEYGIDPTGVGALTGRRRMGEVKMALARHAEEERLAEERFEIAMGQRPAPTPEAQQAAAQELFGPSAPDITLPGEKPCTALERGR